MLWNELWFSAQICMLKPYLLVWCHLEMRPFEIIRCRWVHENWSPMMGLVPLKEETVENAILCTHFLWYLLYSSMWGHIHNATIYNLRKCPHQELNLMTSDFAISSLQNSQKINFCSLSHSVYAFCYDIPRWLRQDMRVSTWVYVMGDQYSIYYNWYHLKLFFTFSLFRPGLNKRRANFSRTILKHY
jgi:hypothetical protein